MFENTITTYTAKRIPNTKSIEVYYNNKQIDDKNKVYVFNTDGSAISRSTAWGNVTNVPAGTFSYLIKKFENVEKLNSEIAKELVIAYEKQYSDKKM